MHDKCFWNRVKPWFWVRQVHWVHGIFVKGPQVLLLRAFFVYS